MRAVRHRGVSNRVTHRADRAIDEAFEPRPQRVDVVPFSRELRHQTREASLRPLGRVHVVASHELVGALIQRVVREIASHLRERFRRWRRVLDRAEPREALFGQKRGEVVRAEEEHVQTQVKLRVVPYKRTLGWSSKASVGVERRRGRVLKPRGGRRETTAKVLKDRRSPRERSRMGTSV